MGCGPSQAVSVAETKSILKRPKEVNIESLDDEINQSVVEDSSRNKKNDTSKEIITEKMRQSEAFEQKPALEVRKSTFTPLIPLNAPKNYTGTPFDSGKSSKSDMNSINESDSTPSSARSSDSGYLDKEYKHIITEKSDSQLVSKVEKEFVERNNLELGITGKSCPPLLSQKEKETIFKKEEKQSLEMLKNNGLVQRPIINKSNYATFEIVEERLLPKMNSADTENEGGFTRKIPPTRLMQREKTKPSLTADAIEEKLERATQRKQEQTQIKLKHLSNSISIDRKVTFDPNTANNSQVSNNQFSQEIIERQKKLREIRDKLKAKGSNDDALNSARTPRSNELISELDKFRPKTPASFKPDFH